MKGSSCTLVASVLAASTASLTFNPSFACDRDVTLHNPCFNAGLGGGKGNDSGSRQTTARDGEKFAPRFDGLRFIETLVTAHR